MPVQSIARPSIAQRGMHIRIGVIGIPRLEYRSSLLSRAPKPVIFVRTTSS
jgi:hypothetical protein